MKNIFIKSILCTLGLTAGLNSLNAQANKPETFCNPINIDYGYTPIPNFSTWGRHRATADPVIVNCKGEYCIFSIAKYPDLVVHYDKLFL